MQGINYNSIGTPQDEVNEQICIAKNAKFGIVELGVLFGETSDKFCQANPDIEVYGIDPLIPDSMNQNLIGSMTSINDVLRRNSNFNFINDYSYNVVKTWPYPFDYLFIDASHLYEEVKRDFEEWLPLMKRNGIVSLHDSACDRGGPNHWPGPSKLAQELFTDDRVRYIKTVYSLTTFQKL